MAENILDILAPDFINEDAFTLTLATATPKAFEVCDVAVDYSGADVRGGASLPLELIVRAPHSTDHLRQRFELLKPSVVSFFPQSGGRHLVLLREVAHNRLHGKIIIEVQGDDIDEG